MTELSVITLENEMDLILAYKKSIRTAELLGLTISTQTAFATAVSEVCREVIDKAFEGKASVGVSFDSNRFFLTAAISCRIEEDFKRNSEGFDYARKLVPVLETNFTEDRLETMLKLGIPRSARIDQRKVSTIRQQILDEGPISAYEEIKLKNAALHLLNTQQELHLQHATLLDQQKNEFLTLASHELNSPLTVLHSFAQLALKMEGSENEVLNGILKKIEQQSTKMVTLIQQLLDISKIEHGQLTYNKEETDYRDFLEDILETTRMLVPGHQLCIELGDTGLVLIDRLRLEQVLNNVVANAAKYSNEGSCIYIRTAMKDGLITVEVEDEGIGMSEDTLLMVFNKFYRSEHVAHKYGGLGMGLYVASRIISGHQGVMNVHSVPEKGSVFSFSIPVLNQ